MTSLDIICPNCYKVFPSGVNMVPGGTATFIWTSKICPFCKTNVRIPNGSYKSDSKGVIHFQETVKTFIDTLSNAKNPLKEAKKIFEVLQNAQTKGIKKVSWLKRYKFRKWIPNTPEKIAAYLAIVYTLIQLLTKNPSVKIDYNPLDFPAACRRVP